ncbi:MAG TPA: hypothetical protein VFB12_26235 [Ktedonobacteraceae bacterium]|nr:hypothetical protein [Ktedonobacteraceae bacterium]
MKKRILPLLLLGALVCALSIVSFQGTAGVAHAAVDSQRTSARAQAPADVCNNPIHDVVLGFANGFVCIHNSGDFSVGYANVTSVYAGEHTVTFTWQGCDFSWHTSTLKPFAIATAQNSPNGFAGCTAIRLLTHITIS